MKKDPKYEKKLRRHLNEYLHISEEGSVTEAFEKNYTKEQYNEMTFLIDVVKEAMRLKPSANGGLSYDVKEDVTIRGVKIP